MVSDYYIKNGKVGVIISPTYGQGYSSCHTYINPFFVPIVEAVDQCDYMLTESLHRLKYGSDLEFTDFNELVVEWVPLGERFRINEYGGSERIVLYQDDVWYKITE